jgi:uncharacterized protein (TIGR02147 family)
MDLFQETDYRKIIEGLFRSQSNRGHGQTSKLARHLGVNTTLVSQVMNRKRHFTEEQAVEVAVFLNLNQKESYYFLLLVQHARAGTPALRSTFAHQIEKTQREAKQVKGRVSPKKDLSFDEQAIYYSNWLYAAIHTLVSIPGFDQPNAIARKFHIDEGFARTLIEKLVEFNLVREESGKLRTGAASTYINPESPLIARHHQAWRQVSAQKMAMSSSKDFFFTAPFSIAAEDFDEFRKELVELIGRLYKRVEKTRPRELAALNIDLFKL